MPRPSGWMAYLPPVNRSVATPLHTLISSRPLVISPFPSAVKVPARVKKLLSPPQSSLPLMEKAYWPAKLAFENFGAGGGSVPPRPDPPPHPATKARRIEAAKARRFARMIIEHFHWSFRHAALQATPGRRQSPEDIRGAIV